VDKESTIHEERILKNPGFRVVPKELLRHPTMSPNARTILFWMMADDKPFLLEEEEKNIPLSKNDIQKAKSELVELGYLVEKI